MTIFYVTWSSNVQEETPEQTAFREAFEEIGLDDKHIDVWALTPDEVRITLENGSTWESNSYFFKFDLRIIENEPFS